MLRKPKAEALKLNNEINAVLDSMSTYGVDSPEYPAYIEHLDRLLEIQKTKKTSWRPTPDQMLLVGGNLFGVFIIVAYEHLHVVTSKALPLLVKAK